MKTYPSELPVLLLSGHGLSTNDPQVRSELATGRDRVRPSASPPITRVNGSLIVNDGKAMIFEAFWEQTLRQGTEWFEMKVKTPRGHEMQAVRFVGIYRGPELVPPSLWRFSFALEFLNRPIIPAPWATDAPEWILYAGRFDRLMNETWPEYDSN